MQYSTRRSSILQPAKCAEKGRALHKEECNGEKSCNQGIGFGMSDFVVPLASKRSFSAGLGHELACTGRTISASVGFSHAL